MKPIIFGKGVQSKTFIGGPKRLCFPVPLEPPLWIAYQPANVELVARLRNTVASVSLCRGAFARTPKNKCGCVQAMIQCCIRRSAHVWSSTTQIHGMIDVFRRSRRVFSKTSCLRPIKTANCNRWNKLRVHSYLWTTRGQAVDKGWRNWDAVV